MTTEENRELITRITKTMELIVFQMGKSSEILETQSVQLTDIIDRIIHLERMIGIRK